MKHSVWLPVRLLCFRFGCNYAGAVQKLLGQPTNVYRKKVVKGLEKKGFFIKQYFSSVVIFTFKNCQLPTVHFNMPSLVENLRGLWSVYLLKVRALKNPMTSPFSVSLNMLKCSAVNLSALASSWSKIKKRDRNQKSWVLFFYLFVFLR